MTRLQGGTSQGQWATIDFLGDRLSRVDAIVGGRCPGSPHWAYWNWQRRMRTGVPFERDGDRYRVKEWNTDSGVPWVAELRATRADDGRSAHGTIHTSWIGESGSCEGRMRFKVALPGDGPPVFTELTGETRTGRQLELHLVEGKLKMALVTGALYCRSDREWRHGEWVLEPNSAAVFHQDGRRFSITSENQPPWYAGRESILIRGTLAEDRSSARGTIELSRRGRKGHCHDKVGFSARS